MRRPYRLSQTFVNVVSEPGRYGDGRGSKGLSLLVKRTKQGDISKSYTQRIQQPSGKFTSRGLGAHPYISLKDARDMAYENTRNHASIAVAHIAELPTSEPITAPTFKEIAEDYLNANAGRWSANSQKTYECNLADSMLILSLATFQSTP